MQFRATNLLSKRSFYFDSLEAAEEAIKTTKSLSIGEVILEKIECKPVPGRKWMESTTTRIARFAN